MHIAAGAAGRVLSLFLSGLWIKATHTILLSGFLESEGFVGLPKCAGEI